MNNKKVYFIDPGLMDKDGHHYTWTENLCIEARHQGCAIKIFTHKTLKKDALDSLSKFGEVVKLFSIHPFIDPKGLGAELNVLFDGGLALSQELNIIPQDAIWIFPSLYKFQLIGICYSNPKCRISGIIADCIDRYPLMGHAALDYINLKLNHLKIENTLSIFSLESEFSKHQQTLQASQLKILPIPVDTSQKIRKRFELKKIGIFGNWGWKLREQPEKKQTISDTLLSLSDKYELYVHDISGNWSHLNNKKNINVYNGYIDNFFDLTNMCDLILLPYFNKEFTYSNSATYNYCLSYGIPYISPSSTFIGREAEKLNIGTTFNNFDQTSILKAVEKCENMYSLIADTNYNNAVEFRKFNGFNQVFNSLTI
jgi:hypothetical protein